MPTARALALRQRSSPATLSAGSYRAADTVRNRAYSAGVQGGTADRHADDRTRHVVRELCRSLERNADAYAVFKGRWLDDLGVPQPRSVSKDAKWAERALIDFRIYARRQRGGFDRRGMSSWGELFRLWAGHVFEDGDHFLVPTTAGDISSIESERVAARPRGNQHSRTVGGITYDAGGAWQKVWIAPLRGKSPDLVNAKAYDPDQVIPFLYRTRTSQTRGMPPLVAGIDNIERLDSLLESTVISSEQLSNIYGAIKKVRGELARSPGYGGPTMAGGVQPSPTVTPFTNRDNAPDWVDTGRGALLMLYDDQEWQSIQQTQPNNNVPPFVQAILRMIGMGVSYPYEIAFMDLKGLSWSAHKSLVTLARTGLTRFRSDIFEPGLDRLWDWWCRLTYGNQLPKDFDAVLWDWPQLPWPDPLKEEQRNKLAFELNTDSPQRVIGPDWATIYRENRDANVLRDALTIDRIEQAQVLCNTANGRTKGLRLHWSHIVTVGGASSAPGAYLQAANGQQNGNDNANGDNVDDEETTDKDPPKKDAED